MFDLDEPEPLDGVDVFVVELVAVVDDGLGFDLDVVVVVVLGGLTFGLLFSSAFSVSGVTFDVFVILAIGVGSVLETGVGDPIGVELAGIVPCSINLLFIRNAAVWYFCI